MEEGKKKKKEWGDNMQLQPGERKMRQIYRESKREQEKEAKAEIDRVQRKDVLEECSYLNSFPFDTPGSWPFLFDCQ